MNGRHFNPLNHGFRHLHSIRLTIGRIAIAAIAMATASAPVAQIQRDNQIRVDQTTLTEQQTADRFIVSYRDRGKSVDARALQDLLDRTGKALGRRLTRVRRLAVGADLIRADQALDAKGVERLRQELARNPNVEYVSIDRMLQPLDTPNDPLYPQHWHYHDAVAGINVMAAWDIADGAGVVGAVVDTGITDHPDLDANFIPGYDFVSDSFISGDGDGRDPDPHDPGDGVPGYFRSSWHGTHVSGTIAAVTGNGVGVAGVAHGARVQPVRVLGKGGGTLSDIIDAIVWASGRSVPDVPSNPTPADVINMSFGGAGGGPHFSCDPALQAAVTTALTNGTTPVAAAGNNGGPVLQIVPANCDGVIAVAATDPAGARSFYSTFGSPIAVAAPGGSGFPPAESNVLSTINDGEIEPGAPSYAWHAGTSMSAPHVAGVAALIQSASSTRKTPAEVRQIIVNTAYDSGVGAPSGCSWDVACGSGIVDARYATAVSAGLEPLPPALNPYPTPAVDVRALQKGIELTGLSATSSTFGLKIDP
jgi:serine protease